MDLFLTYGTIPKFNGFVRDNRLRLQFGFACHFRDLFCFSCCVNSGILKGFVFNESFSSRIIKGLCFKRPLMYRLRRGFVFL